MKKGYDLIATYYDRLQKIVFGNTLLRAQSYLLPQIPANSCILILGGGAGAILEAIAALQPSGLRITFVDISGNMIAQARQRKCGKNLVKFIHGDVLTFEMEETYDVVMTPFFLDNFTNRQVNTIVTKIRGRLAANAIWLFTDFVHSGKIVHEYVLSIMYVFFRLLCGIDARELPDSTKIIEGAGFALITEAHFLAGFIQTACFRVQPMGV